MKKILLFFVAQIFFSAYAQVNWQKLSVPNENISSLTVSSNNRVFAGTYTYGVFESVDDGTNWENISLGLGDSLITALQIANGDTLFAGTGSHGIYRYYHGSWTPINDGLPSNNLYVTGFARNANGNMYMMDVNGKIYSWNSIKWTDITYNFPSSGRAIAVGPSGILYASAFASGVYRFDGVNNWSLVGAAMPNNFVIKITVGANDTIYAACNSNNVFRCAAAGGNWTSINAGLPPVNINFLFSDAQNRLFIGSNTANSFLYRSLNNGDSWALVSTNIYSTAFNCITASPSGKIYAGASGVFRSADGGDSWSDMNPGMDAPKAVFSFTCSPNGNFFLATRYGPWRSTDNGNTWQFINAGILHPLVLQITTNAAGDLLCHGINGTPKGAIYRSINNGDSWSLVAANGCDRYTKIKQHKSDTIWATSRFSGATSLQYSIDNGATWSDNPLKISAIWDIDFGSGSSIFLGSESEGVSRSDDGGISFIQGVGNTIPWYGNVIEVETDRNGFVFAGGDWWTHILWFSPPGENGNAWTQFTDPDLVVHGVIDLVFDQHNNAYVACTNGGVRMAYDTDWTAGTNWIQSSSGLPSADAYVLELDFDISGYIYSVCYSGNGHNAGLFRSTIPVNPAVSSTYTFTGNGDWSIPSNWKNNLMPPAILSGNAMIIIDPPANGECVLNINQQVLNGAIIKVMPGKKFTQTGMLEIQ